MPATDACPFELDTEFWSEVYTYLSPMLDLRDWGLVRKGDKGPRHHLGGTVLERWVNGKSVSNAQRKELQPEHLQANGGIPAVKFYFKGTLTRGSPCLLGLDFDAHNGEQDVSEVARWAIDAWFPQAFMEPSNNGVHAYIKVNHEGATPEQLRDILNRLNRVMDAARVAHGFHAKVDGFKGTPSQGKYVDRSYVFPKGSRGTLMRLPILRFGHTSLRELRDSPCFDLQHLLNLGETLGWAPVKAMGQRKVYPPRLSLGNTQQPPLSPMSSHPTVGVPLSVEDLTARAKRSPNPSERMRLALAIVRKTDPEARIDAEQLVDVYVSLGFSTGDETRPGVRLERAQQALQRAHFEPERWLPVIASGVSPTLYRRPDVWGTGKPTLRGCPISNEVLAASLCLITHQCLVPSNEPRFRFTTSQAQLLPYLNALHAQGILLTPPPSKTRNQGLIFRILEASGLIVRRESPRRRRPGESTGVGTKYGLGLKHPMWNEWVAVCLRLGQDPELRLVDSRQPTGLRLAS